MEVEDLFSGGARNEETQSAGQSPLKSLQVDLDFYSESIREVAMEIIEEGYSSYPIFVAHQHEVSVGEVILDRVELNTNWTINASTLEEFVEMDIIQEDRKATFVQNYKPAKDYMCLFVVVAEGANFVFYPYK
ncbi:MAG: hypothetical protein K0R59_4289 [Sphingobacterium sp.]|jgi:hypothetical protein|uniref:hypothetical protein n=1 Tax=unclassified Sphingobacterium TaxID=2609468 RepID=UPI0009872B71|nr:hypothetical protein [Sphingobacterium sp. CZ-UAM]MDF2518993.1 hypothetical protein [Sphingobacterium sp.]OOG16562.1 hypothetical protein BWD42_20220 [Sphingobacterium sp. CZ-UAM]